MPDEAIGSLGAPLDGKTVIAGLEELKLWDFWQSRGGSASTAQVELSQLISVDDGSLVDLAQRVISEDLMALE